MRRIFLECHYSTLRERPHFLLSYFQGHVISGELFQHVLVDLSSAIRRGKCSVNNSREAISQSPRDTHSDSSYKQTVLVTYLKTRVLRKRLQRRGCKFKFNGNGKLPMMAVYTFQIISAYLDHQHLSLRYRLLEELCGRWILTLGNNELSSLSTKVFDTIHPETRSSGHSQLIPAFTFTISQLL